MRYTLALPALPALAGLAHALPQGINFNVIATAAPATASGPAASATAEAPTVVYNAPVVQSSVAAAVSTAPVNSAVASPAASKRDPNAPCGAQPAGSGPTINNPDTDTHFENSPVLQSYSLSAPTPPGYTESFFNLNGSTQLSTYMGYYTLTSYSPNACANYCNQATGCQAFNIYFERDPTLNPADACPNPASTTNIKCTLYGSQINSASATNMGQYRDQFHVVIAGSNGYNKFIVPSFQAGYTAPTPLNGAINVVSQNGNNVYVGARYFNQPYDAGVCAALCNATTADNRAAAQVKYSASQSSGGSYDGTYTACNYFNAYILSENNAAQGIYCSLYSTSISSSYATVQNTQSGGNTYSVSYSYGFSASSPDSGSVAH